MSKEILCLVSKIRREGRKGKEGRQGGKEGGRKRGREGGREEGIWDKQKLNKPLYHDDRERERERKTEKKRKRERREGLRPHQQRWTAGDITLVRYTEHRSQKSGSSLKKQREGQESTTQRDRSSESSDCDLQ
jgi:hypothetical protein